MIFPTQKQLELFKRTPGAISVHEMVAIMNVVAQAPNGVFCEMGSHRGKSGTAAAFAMAMTHGFNLHMVDPLYDMTNLEAWSHACQGHPDNAWCGAKEEGFNESIVALIAEASEGAVLAVLHGDFSTHAIPEIYNSEGQIAYCFLDSDQHQYELVKEELGLLKDRMMIGGIIGFHDFQSQYLGVEQAYREALEGDIFHEVSIDWEQIKGWVSGHGGEEGNESWHHKGNPAPCFFGALRKNK